MEFNRIISLVLGFIVLILVFIWIAGRFRSTPLTTSKATISTTITITPTPTTKKPAKKWDPLAFLFNRKTTISPTLSKTPTPTKKTQNADEGQNPQITNTYQTTNEEIIEEVYSETIVYRNNHSGNTQRYETSGIKRIPQTGSPTIILPLTTSLLALGIYLRRKK